MDRLSQARNLVVRPHVVIATPGQIKVLLEEDPDIPPVFSKTKNDVVLLHATKADLGRQLEEFECKEQEVLSDIKRASEAVGLLLGSQEQSDLIRSHSRMASKTRDAHPKTVGIDSSNPSPEQVPWARSP